MTAEEIRKAIEEPVNAIVDAVKTTLDKCPPELSGDIMDRGIVLTGGGALLRGLDERLRHETGMPIHIAEDPLDSVALGSGKCVEEFEALQQVLDRRAAHSWTSGAGRAPTDRGPAAMRDMNDTRDARRAAAGAAARHRGRLITVDIRGGEDSPLDGARSAAATVFGPVERVAAAIAAPVGRRRRRRARLGGGAADADRLAAREQGARAAGSRTPTLARSRAAGARRAAQDRGRRALPHRPGAGHRDRRGPGLLLDRHHRRRQQATASSPT